MRGKIVSYLKARVRSISEGKGYRGEVISAMIDMDSEFKIGDEVIKPKGELLSLTAQEAVKLYGDPPQPLLGAGIAENLDALAGPDSTARETTRVDPAGSHLVGKTRAISHRAHAAAAGGWAAVPVHRVQDAGLRNLRHLRNRCC